MSKRLVILFYPLSTEGHIKPSIGLGQQCLTRGHKIICVISSQFKGQLTKYGFEEEVLNSGNTMFEMKMSGEQFASNLINSGILSQLSSIDKMRVSIGRGVIPWVVNSLPVIEPQLKSIIDKHNPDVIIIDNYVTSPTVMYSGKPWVYLLSSNPVAIEDEMTPPVGSGYPTDSDSNGWLEFKQLYRQYLSSDEYNEYLISNGFPLSADNRVLTFSPFLNIYNFPKELDYTDIRPLPDKWMGVDALVKKSKEAFELPVQLKGWKGKLIYLSLGSIGSLDTELMKRLVNILSKSKHKFIVSKGLFGDKYELADNMWGQRSVPQTKVLPLVDLVLTHGGNNTVTETSYFGKPMIVLPLVGGQYDNAQRVHEKKLGVRLDPYLCSEKELLNTIEMLLNDNELKERLILMSKRIQASDSLERAVDKIEALVI